MARYIKPGKSIDYPNTTGSTIAYGTIVKLTSIIGVAAHDIADKDTGTVMITGVYELPAESTETLEVGEKVYWVTGDKVSKTDGGSDPVAGIVVEKKESSTATAIVKIG